MVAQIEFARRMAAPVYPRLDQAGKVDDARITRRAHGLPALLEEIKKKPVAGLDSTQNELDRLTEWFVEKYVTDKISSEVFDSAAARVMHLRDLIKKRQEANQVVTGEQVEPGGGVAGRRATAETES